MILYLANEIDKNSNLKKQKYLSYDFGSKKIIDITMKQYRKLEKILKSDGNGNLITEVKSKFLNCAFFDKKRQINFKFIKNGIVLYNNCGFIKEYDLDDIETLYFIFETDLRKFKKCGE